MSFSAFYLAMCTASACEKFHFDYLLSLLTPTVGDKKAIWPA